jgi:hypothetical protein
VLLGDALIDPAQQRLQFGLLRQFTRGFRAGFVRSVFRAAATGRLAAFPRAAPRPSVLRRFADIKASPVSDRM